MLSAVITLFETIKTIGYYSIYLSYNTGKIIVNGFIISFDVLHNLLTTLWTLLVILQEDLLVFLIDLLRRVVLLLNEIHIFTEYVSEYIVFVLTCMKNVVMGTSDAIITFFQTLFTIINKMISNIGALIATIKYLIVLFGSGVWFVITIVPLFIVYVCVMTTYYTGRAFEELKNISCALATQIGTGLQDIFTFVTDVPLESLAGLIVCFCLIYAVVVFQIELYSTLRRFTRDALTVVNRNFIRLKAVLCRRRNNLPNADVDNSSSTSSSDNEQEEDFEPIPGLHTERDRSRKSKKESRLCVICMERNKCILSMPCRHLVTCSECNNILRQYQRTCPMCRGYVSYTIHVY